MTAAADQRLISRARTAPPATALPLSVRALAEEELPEGQIEPLGTGWTAVTVVIGIMAALIALGGMVLSFRAVSQEMVPAFGTRWAWLVPIVVDLTVFVFSGVDLVLARLDMGHPLARWTVYGATAGTVWLNYSVGGSAAGRVAHVLMPSIWVVFIELMRHVVRRQANLATGSHREPIPAARWFLSPWPTLKLWRRMVLWRVNSYPRALEQEKMRLGAVATAREMYGRFWRVRISPLTKLQINLGELGARDLNPNAVPVLAPVLAAAAVPAATAAQAPAAPVADPVHAPPMPAPAPVTASSTATSPMPAPNGTAHDTPLANGNGYGSGAPHTPTAARVDGLAAAPVHTNGAPHAPVAVSDGPRHGGAQPSMTQPSMTQPAAQNGAPAGPRPAAQGPAAPVTRHAAPHPVNGAQVPRPQYSPAVGREPIPSVSAAGVDAAHAAANGAALPAKRGETADLDGPPDPQRPAHVEFQAPPPMPPMPRRSTRESELLTAAREVERWRGRPSATRISRELSIGMPLATSLANALSDEDGFGQDEPAL